MRQNRDLYAISFSQQIHEQIPDTLQQECICQVCFCNYNLKERVPMNICDSQHHCCMRCLNQILSKKPQCPFCKKIINRNQTNKSRIIVKILEDAAKKKGIDINPPKQNLPNNNSSRSAQQYPQHYFGNNQIPNNNAYQNNNGNRHPANHVQGLSESENFSHEDINQPFNNYYLGQYVPPISSNQQPPYGQNQNQYQRIFPPHPLPRQPIENIGTPVNNKDLFSTICFAYIIYLFCALIEFLSINNGGDCMSRVYNNMTTSLSSVANTSSLSSFAMLFVGFIIICCRNNRQQKCLSCCYVYFMIFTIKIFVYSWLLKTTYSNLEVNISNQTCPTGFFQYYYKLLLYIYMFLQVVFFIMVLTSCCRRKCAN